MPDMGEALWRSFMPVFLKVFLPFAVLAVALALGQSWLLRLVERLVFRGVDMARVDRMPGDEFERYVAWLLEREGYRDVTRTPYRGDKGADLLATDPSGKRWAIQVKRWRWRVGSQAVQAAVAARDYYRADGAMVITNSRFTAHARDYAWRTGTVLWDRRRLAECIRRASQAALRPPGA